MHVEAGQQRERAVRTYSCSTRTGLPGAAGALAWSGRGPGSTASRRGQDPVTGPQRLPAVKPLVEVEDHARLGLEVRVAGVDPGLVLPRPDRVPARIRSTDDTDTGPARPRAASSAASSGPVHRDSGTPVAAGSWQASATTAARSAPLIRRGRPDRGRSSARQAQRREPARHFRTVSAPIRISRATGRYSRSRRGASSISAAAGPARRLRPGTRFFSVLRSAAVSVTGTAAATAYGGSRAPSTPGAIPLPGHGMITSARCPRAAQWSHMPAIPDSTRSSITLRLLDHAEKHWPQLARVQVSYRGAFAYLAGRVLRGRRDHPAMPPALRRLRESLRLRDRRLHHRARDDDPPHRRHPENPPTRSSSHRLHRPPRRPRPRTRPLTPEELPGPSTK